jgi:hypothetical protein
MSSQDKNARRKGEKAGSVWEKKSKKMRVLCHFPSWKKHEEENNGYVVFS